MGPNGHVMSHNTTHLVEMDTSGLSKKYMCLIFYRRKEKEKKY